MRGRNSTGMPGNQRQKGSKRIMRRINYVAAILVLPTLLYAVPVILNPFNYFGGGDGEQLFAIAYMLTAYDGKASAIQLIGTTIIAFGIIISQENLNARMASLAGATLVWIGLLQGMAANPLLVITTLVIFVGLTTLQAIAVGAYLLMPTVFRLTPLVIAVLIRFINDAQQWAVYRAQSMGNRSGVWLRWFRQTARQLWPF